MNINSQDHVQNLKDNDEVSFDLKAIINKLADKWMWFIGSIFLCLLVAYLYTRYTAPLYKISAKLFISEQEKGGGVGGTSGALMDLGGLMGSNNSVENEVEILKTRFLMEQVVRKMQLNVVYSAKGQVVANEIYKPPFQLNIIQGRDTITTTNIEVHKLPGDKFRISSGDFEKTVGWNETFSLKNIGKLQLSPVPNVKFDEDSYLITINNIDSRVTNLMGQLSVSPVNKQVSIIELGLTYPIPRKGEDILATLINKYNEANLMDKNAIADSTGKFIKERLAIISEELGDVENKVEGFKQRNQLADMSEQGKYLVQNTGALTTELAKAETQVSVLKELEEYLKDEGNNKRVFPSSLINQDLVFSNLLNQYNSLLVERDKLLLSVTEESPFIENIDNQIAGLRKGILSNIQSTKSASILTRDRLKNQLQNAESKIIGVPEIEKNYLKLARKQEIKQELYIYLMKKSEETAISKASNIAISKTIDPPKSNPAPISPKKNAIYLAALIIGLILPIGLILIRDLLNTAISNKDDITNQTQVPIIGEINHNIGNDNLVVANQSRSAISEQFRALRTNLSFYLKTNDQKVILLTSSMSGEGKSFTAINLGNILALTGKKVLLMELDLRKPGLSVKLGVNNDIGFSNYTISTTLKTSDIIKPLAINPNMFIISSGPLPPNPAETIMSENTSKLIAELKNQFDYIIMDAPPIGIITDAQLLSSYADVTLYLVRQKVTQKSQLNIVEDLYRNGKMKNIGIVVNDIVNKYYGYGYGYGYGTYGEASNPSFFKRISNKLKNG